EYLGLTGAKLKGKEIVSAGLATHFVPSDKLVCLEKSLLSLTTGEEKAIRSAIQEFSTKIEIDERSILNKDWIRSERRNFGIAESQPAIDEAYEEMMAEIAEDAASPGSGSESDYYSETESEDEVDVIDLSDSDKNIDTSCTACKAMIDSGADVSAFRKD
uniref:3-hydroxyisobutyryl-CoA hydrolase n=1 Tax=Nicotiana tabacum TaxID=4097 RepID=A0A1S3X9L1_TOBAC